jgi:hypothetical protein
MKNQLMMNKRRKEGKITRSEMIIIYNFFCQKCHNEGHLTKECKLMQTICNIYKKERHETNDYPLKELRR